MIKKLMNSKYYQNLCVKSVTGNINENEMEELSKWLLNSKENQKMFDNMKSIWLNSLIYQNSELPDTEIEWNLLNDKLLIDNSHKRKKIRITGIFDSVLFNVYNFKLKAFTAAAAGLIIIAVTALILNKT